MIAQKQYLFSCILSLFLFDWVWEKSVSVSEDDSFHEKRKENNVSYWIGYLVTSYGLMRNSLVTQQAVCTACYDNAS